MDSTSTCVPVGLSKRKGSPPLNSWKHSYSYSHSCSWPSLLWEWIAGWVSTTRTLMSFLIELVSSQGLHSVHWCMRWLFPRYRVLCFPVMNFMRFLLSHFSSPSRLLRMAGQSFGISATPPSNFASPANLLKECSAPSLRWLIRCYDVFFTVFTPRVYHLWLASSWTWYHWSQYCEVSSYFQSPSLCMH